MIDEDIKWTLEYSDKGPQYAIYIILTVGELLA
jgi:hypothetical protein